MQLEQIFGHQDANDVFAIAFVDGKARVCGVNHLVQQLVERRINGQQLHAGRGDHGITGSHVGHANHAFQHEATLRIDDLVVFGLCQCFDQLIGRVWPWVNKFSQFLQK